LLDLIIVAAENVTSHKYVFAKVNNILIAFPWIVGYFGFGFIEI
jgi:hypothetical protein